MSAFLPGQVKIEAILFDKDGTLFDFQATWNAWTGRMIDGLCPGDARRACALARAIGYDMASGTVLPDSPVIAGTHRDAVEIVARALPHRPIEEIDAYLMTSAARARQTPVLPLAAFLDGLTARGLALGVMTNDTEFSARAHLDAAGVAARFAFLAGFDSGYGAKPAPDPLLAFARAVGVDPGRVAMVGDSTHDLIAGRAAGMRTLGVLTGMAPEAELAPHADAVLPDIGHIPAWLDA